MDHIVSFLCILHIPARQRLFRKAAEALKPGGKIYIEDYFAREPLDEHASRVLRDVISCPHLPSEQQYRADLAGAKLDVVRWEDMTTTWSEFVHKRAVEYRKGEEIEESLAAFYDVVDWLFSSGTIGGCRITAVNREIRDE